MAEPNELWVWMNGERVGVWHRTRTGTHRFVYAASWPASPRTRPLSLSIPVTPDLTVTGPEVGAYFDNLLPDAEHIRRRVATRFRTNSTEAFELLQAIGRDCVGAVQLLPPQAEPEGFDRIDFEPMNDADIEQHLRQVVSEPGLGRTDADDDKALRISIAGAQEKSALTKVDGQWGRPLGATPTTHILKLPLGLVGGRRLDLSHSVQNEWLCAQLLRALGLPVANTEMARFGDQLVLVVERFDRAWAKRTDGQPWIARLPQEDFCQALGVASHLKYESDAERGGVGLAAGQRLLMGGQAPQADITTFLRAQLAFWLLAATDGHAKNFSIFLLPGGSYRLTPLYDVISVWPVVGNGPNHVRRKEARLAMGVHSRNKHYRIADIHARHWRALAGRAGVPGLWADMCALVDRVDAAIATVQASLASDFPARTAQAIFDGMRAQAKAWHSELAAGKAGAAVQSDREGLDDVAAGRVLVEPELDRALSPVPTPPRKKA